MTKRKANDIHILIWLSIGGYMSRSSQSPNVYRFIWSYVSRVKGMFFCMLILLFVSELCRQMGIYYASRIAGAMTEHADKSLQIKQALKALMLMSVFAAGRSVLVNLKSVLAARWLPRLRVRLTKDMFERAQKHSLRFFVTEMSGRIASKINQIIEAVIAGLNILDPIFGSVSQLVIAFFFLSAIHYMMGLALIVFAVIYFWFVAFSGHKLVDVMAAGSNKRSIVNGVITDTLFNYAIVKNDGQMLRERQYLFSHIIPWVRAERKIYLTELWVYLSQGVIRAILKGCFLCVPVYLWIKHEISVADFVLAESLISYLILYALSIGFRVSRLFRCVGRVKDGIAFLYQPVEITDKPNASALHAEKGCVRFNQVDFGYLSAETDKSAQYLFRQFNLEIKAGDKVGLVGSSGAGKSTLIKLINRYYDVAGGQILIDSQNIADVTQESLHHHIALIEQNPALFNRTIMENIRYGRLNATDEEVIEAAKKAYIHDFIMRMPDGYHTKVGERGVILSGGERQRIAIARAILKEAPILILDEATSALDTESEEYIQLALADLMQQKTVIAIAHRLSTLREMDYLLVLDKGQIVEKGAHDVLLAQNGIYAAFYQLQAKGFQEGA